MLAAGPEASPIASRPVARPVCSIISRSACGIGIMERQQAGQGPDLGITTSVP